MGTNNMKKETLVDLASEIINKIEKVIRLNLNPNSDVNLENKLEEEMNYSLRYIRDVFGDAIGIGLKTYIKRRLYTSILETIGEESFLNLNKTKEIYCIKEFKNKCIKEFPFLKYNFDIAKMQQCIDVELLPFLINNSIFKESVYDKEMVTLIESEDKILIQDDTNIIVDLNKTIFKIKDKVFYINARENEETNRKDEFLSSLFGKDIYMCDFYPIDVNQAVMDLNKSRLNRPISISTNWSCDSDSSGMANLILSTYNNNGNYNVELSDHNFIIFEEGKVWLNVSFYAY